MSSQWQGRTAVVTGAAGGVGLVLAKRFALEGMRLVMTDLDLAELEAARREVEAEDVFLIAADVSDSEDVDILAKRTFEKFGTPYILCNNAGVNVYGFSSWQAPMTTWDWILGVNLYGVLHGIRSFLPTMLEANDGHIVNVTSPAMLRGRPFMGHYGATKHAVLAISEALRHELAEGRSKVNVSVLSPGRIDSSRLRTSARLWPSRLGEPAAVGPRGVPITPEPGQSITPEELGDCLLGALAENRFLAMPEREMKSARRAVNGRLAMLDGADPLAPRPLEYRDQERSAETPPRL